jgi:hypothetical protein
MLKLCYCAKVHYLVNGTDLGSFPMTAFGISSVESSGSVAKELVRIIKTKAVMTLSLYIWAGIMSITHSVVFHVAEMFCLQQ